MYKLLDYIELEGDRTIWVVVSLLCLFSIVIVYSTAGISDIVKRLNKVANNSRKADVAAIVGDKITITLTQ